MDNVGQFAFSAHAKENMKSRKIKRRWVQSAFNSPDIRQYKRDGKVHYLRKIAEHGNHYLRVIVDTRKKPKIIITVYFDSNVS